MINIIRICPDGHVIPESDCLGRTGENNATVLRFSFFEELNGKSVSDFRKRLVAIFPEGVLKYELNGDFSLPGELTSSEELTLLIEILNSDEILFKSYPHTFNLIRSGDNPETNLLQAAADSARENCRSELETSIETATGESHDNKTWEELNETVKTEIKHREDAFEEIEGMINKSGVIEYDNAYR